MSVPSNATKVTVVIELTNTNQNQIQGFLTAIQNMVNANIPSGATVNNFVAQYATDVTITQKEFLGLDVL